MDTLQLAEKDNLTSSLNSHKNHNFDINIE